MRSCDWHWQEGWLGRWDSGLECRTVAVQGRVRGQELVVAAEEHQVKIAALAHRARISSSQSCWDRKGVQSNSETAGEAGERPKVVVGPQHSEREHPVSGGQHPQRR